MIKALLIEDERKAARELKEILEELRPDIRILDTLESIEESVEWLRQNPAPDLIFSDIQLADGLSFDIFKAVSVASPIIFCTAFDEYMLHAFEANGINYLLKPINKGKLEQSLKKYDDLKKALGGEPPDYLQQLEHLLRHTQPNYRSTLLVHVKDKIIPIRTEDIAYLYYSNGVVALHLENNRQYFVQESLDDLEKELNPQVFFRANRQFLIHRHSITDIEHYFSRKLMVKLKVKAPENVLISKAKASAFLKWLENR